MCGSWEAQAAQLHLRMACLLGQLAQLRQFEAEYSSEAEMLVEQEEAYNDKLAKVVDKASGKGRGVWCKHSRTDSLAMGNSSCCGCVRHVYWQGVQVMVCMRLGSMGDAGAACFDT